jgi:ABC-type multidrug transport system permease subunit
MSKTNPPIAILALVLITAGCAMIAWPLAIIWALNTLFITLSIPYSFWTWLAVAVLNVSTFGGLASTIKNTK